MAGRIAVGLMRQCLSRNSTLPEGLRVSFPALSSGGEARISSDVRRLEVRCASGGAANPAREAKAASPSKVVKKGGAAKVGEGGPDRKDRFKSLIQSCLDAPAPVRHLKEKDRLREVEREKLGIVSKDKERALERDKAKAKAAAKEKKKAGGLCCLTSTVSYVLVATCR